MQDNGGVSLKTLILVPSIVTLAVTLLRLAGELLGWSSVLFSREAGGAGAIVGIVWLVPVFGAYFALKLAAAGQRPPGIGAALGYSILGFAVVPGAGFVSSKLGVPQQSFTAFGVFMVFSLIGAVLAFRGWPALGRTLLAYGFAARIPVAIVMLFAILGRWGTHYDALPPNFPSMSPIVTWLLIGVLPQLVIWIWFTITAGAVFGALAVLVTGRARQPATA
jgi:hypothetical protein